MKTLIAAFAAWLLILFFLMQGTAHAGVFFLERDGGWTEWKGLPDGGVR